jgi:hypothetical protein
MKNKIYIQSGLYISLILMIVVLISGCKRDIDELEPADYPTDGEVFIDGFSAGLAYEAWGDVTAFDVDMQVKYKGSASMKFAVPDEGQTGGFAGGRYYTEFPRDLSGYDALTFWIKATKAASIDEIGFAKDDLHEASLKGIKVNTNWKKVIIPIPDPSKLVKETGLFFYSEGPEDGSGYTFWIDEVQFEKLGTIAHNRPQIMNGEEAVESAVNNLKIPITGLGANFNLPNGIDQLVYAAPAYFTFSSSDDNVASVDEKGVVTVNSAGTAKITAKVGEILALGSLTINSAGSFVHAPTPTLDAMDVISIFSNAYTNVPVEYYNGYWAPYQTTQSADFTVEGDDVLNYLEFNFVGIQFTTPTIDATNMTHLHVDIYIPNPVDPAAQFSVKVVDLGPDGAFGDPDPSVSMTYTSPDPLVEQSWISLDISLSSLASKDKLAQIIFENLDSPLKGFYADNIYLYNDGGSSTTGPEESAPDPTKDPSDVISVFSDSYENLQGTDFYADWGQSTLVSEQLIGGNNTLIYKGLNYQGIVLGGATDVSGMDYLHLDYWTDNSDLLNVFLISDGVETPYGLSVPTSGWNSVDIPLSAFAPVDLAKLIQFKFDGNGTIYLDNIFFYKDGGSGPTEPTEAAPDPIHDEANVFSVFSDSYLDIEGTDFNPDWGQSTVVTTEDLFGNAALKYAEFNYQGTQLGTTQDLSGMKYMHLDMWTADATVVLVTPISETTGELPVSLEPIQPGQWNSYDIPLSTFTDAGMTLADIFQLKFDGQQGVTPSNIWLDNLYFYTEGSGPTEPTEAAPEPTQDEANVISVFSDSYMDIEGTDFNPNWGQSTVVTTEDLFGNAALKYAEFNYQGTQLGTTQDLSGMKYMHLDMWTADATVVLVTPISETTGELLVSLEPIQAGQWNSYDIPLSTFTDAGMTLADIFQLKFDGQQGVTPSNIWLDNIYFYTEGSGPTEPTEAAPDPTQDAADVISVFSDSYTDIDATDFNPNWGQSTVVTTEMIDGNNTLRYADFNYQGTQLGTTQDLSGMKYMHLDMWTADATVVLVTPISETTGELLVSLEPIQPGQWNSYDIPLSTFTGAGMTLADIFQLKFDGQQGVTPSNIWLDNIYFYKEGGSQGDWNTDEAIDFEGAGFGSSWSWNVFENDSNPPLEFVANPDPSGINTSAKVAKITALQTGQPWVGCETQHGELGLFNIDANHKIVKIMVYKTVISDVGIKIVKPDGWSVGEIKVANTVVNAWEELTFDFSTQLESGYDQIVVFPDFDLAGRTADNVIYFDNIRFVAN